MVRRILFTFFTLYISHLSLAQAQDQNQNQREFRFESEIGQKAPAVIENWDGGDGHIKLTLIESAEELAKGNVLKVLGDVPEKQQILFLNLSAKPESPDEITKLILADERVRALPNEMATELQEELSAYKQERADMVKKNSKHIAAIHFISSLGAFTVISYLGEDLPHVAHWLVGFALAWECWLGQRYLLQINRFIYNTTDNFFKSSENFLKKLGLENRMSRFAIDLEKIENDSLPPHRSLPKKLMVSFFTLMLYSVEWAVYDFQHTWITEFFKSDSPFGENLNTASKVVDWAFWGFVIKASLLDLFSEGLPHWAVNNYSRTSKLSYTEQATFIYKWSSAISLFVTCTTIGALATNYIAFKWVAFPIAAAGFGYFIFDGVLRQRFQGGKITLTPVEKINRPEKKYSCLLRLSSS